jgi:xylitol oxidase
VNETNWAGNIAYTARAVHRPTCVEELQELVRAAPRVHVIGSRHTFNAIADSAELISLAGLPQNIEVDAAAGVATVPAAMTYGAVSAALDSAGVGLHNLASLPHVSVGGAVATATHGSGDANGNLATAVTGLELVTSSGEALRAARGDPDFDGMVVSLGALGAVTRLTLMVEPTYQLAQTVYERLPWERLLAGFASVMATGYSVSLFTSWGDSIEQVWVKSRFTADSDVPDELFGARAATIELHPATGMDPRACTPQLGLPGAWWTRLTHFRLEHQPSVGDELQSEYMVARSDALAAIEAVRGLADRIRPLLITSEIRTVRGDDLWLSPEYQRDSVCLHFTWQPRQPEVEALLVHLEAALAPFSARPHWGKLFLARANTLRSFYPRLPDFLKLAHRLDPRAAFTNAWFSRHVQAGGSLTG